MATFKANFPFDTTLTNRIIVTYDSEKGNFTAAVRLLGAADGYGVYSSGSTPQAAVDRALESAERPERWRRLKF